SPGPRAFAPWEVTRVCAGGLTFFPTGSPSSGRLQLDERPAATWYQHEPDALPIAGHKAFADGKGGILAHAAGGLVYVKIFPEIAADEQAPGERPIEIYACPRYVELEVQGPYRRIASGASLEWSVTWYLRALPPGIDVSAGSEGLFSFVGELVAEIAAARPDAGPMATRAR
ncbi:MAG: hypothetical protein JOZ69_25580, partial [Myxococcales bacterium]|nr:hypothetical protein [Myxococcales bacterium]